VRSARRPHAGRRIGVLVALTGLAAGLSACSTSDAQSLARQACAHVQRSVQAWERSTRPGTPARTVSQLQKQAAAELRAALPLAARANSADGSWNSLMTTISEGATVDESHLVPALHGECVEATTNQNVNPQSPGNPQPPNTENVNPQSPGG
jgi:hypothetical protein